MDDKHALDRKQAVERAIGDLHQTYVAGNLRILTGAGISVSSRFPNWTNLNKALLRKRLQEDSRIAENEREDIVDGLFDHLGRDGVAELVSRWKGKEFPGLLSQVLYERRKIREIGISSIQQQIAALAIDPTNIENTVGFDESSIGDRQAKLYTTNFDSMLELALATAEASIAAKQLDTDLLTESIRKFRSPAGPHDSRAGRKSVQVEHLHGWVDTEGESGGTVVFSESQYVDLQTDREARPNSLVTILSSTGATLIVGMSLQDPNLRRILHKLARKSLADTGSKIYAILRESNDAIAHYLRDYWKFYRVNVITVRDHDEVPGLLRKIQWGLCRENTPPNWVMESLRLTRITPDTLRSPEWATLANTTLSVLQNCIKNAYTRADQERIGVSFFAPLQENPAQTVYLAEVWAINDSGSGPVNGDAYTQSQQRRFRLEVGNVQGLAGISFVKGASIDCIEWDSPYIDRKFDDVLRNLYYPNGREGCSWRSILAVPVMDGPLRVPIGVVCITSNLGRANGPQPFWRRPEVKEDLDLLLPRFGRKLLRRVNPA